MVGMDDYFQSIRLHLTNGRRTAAELDHLSSRHIFHINWFFIESPTGTAGWGEDDIDKLYTDLEQKPIWRHGTLYGSERKKLGVASFTV
jgi:hypothetical protein